MILLLLLQAAWADETLPVRDGLEVWLDASRLNAARKASGKPELAPDAPVDAWPDAMGRDALAPDEASRPVRTAAGIRFDGRRQHLLATSRGRTFEALTLFVVAAPFSNRGAFQAFLAINADGANDFVSGLT